MLTPRVLRAERHLQPAKKEGERKLIFIVPSYIDLGDSTARMGKKAETVTGKGKFGKEGTRCYYFTYNFRGVSRRWRVRGQAVHYIPSHAPGKNFELFGKSLFHAFKEVLRKVKHVLSGPSSKHFSLGRTHETVFQ